MTEVRTLASRRMPREVKGISTWSGKGERAAVLAVVRESDEHDLLLMEGMIQQTLSYMPGSRAVDRARELGVRPLTLDGATCEGATVIELRAGGTRAVLMRIDDTYFLYSMSSAAKVNRYGENDWTSILVDVIANLRPELLVTATPSRLVRSLDESGTVLAALTRHVREVKAGTLPLPFEGPHREMSHMVWTMMSTIATAERTLIVQRLNVGQINKWRRGEWLHAHRPPLGYHLDEATNRLEVDPRQTDAVRTAWTHLADPDVAPWRVLQALRDSGIDTRRTGAPGESPRQLHPHFYIRRLFEWAPTYLTGLYTIRWANPFEGVTQVAGLDVHPTTRPEAPFGEFHLTYDLGRPDVDPVLIEAAVDAREARRRGPRTGGAAHRRIPLLTSTSWTEGDLEYWLAPSEGSYTLRVRDVLPEIDGHAKNGPTRGVSPGRGHNPHGLPDGNKIAVVTAVDLHESMLSAFARGLRTGVPAEVLDGYRAHMDARQLTLVDETGTAIKQLRRDAGDNRRKATNARENANDQDDADLRQQFLADARRYTDEARRLDRQAAELESDEASRAVPDEFTCEVDHLIRGLDGLRGSDGLVDREVKQAFAKVVRNIRMRRLGNEIQWSAELLVPAAGRVLILGPFTGIVRARGRLRTDAELATDSHSKGGAIRRRDDFIELENAGFPTNLARAAAAAPHRLIVRTLLGESVEWPDASPSFDHERFSQHIRNTWSSGVGWQGSLYCPTSPKRQALADLVAARGGETLLADIEPELESIDLKHNSLCRLTVVSATHPVGLPYPPVVTRWGPWGHNTSRSLRAVRSVLCQSCGQPATAVVRVVEVPDTLLCRTCLVMPSNPQLVFPMSYLSLALPPVAF